MNFHREFEQGSLSIHQLFREIVTQLGSSFLLQRVPISSLAPCVQHDNVAKWSHFGAEQRASMLAKPGEGERRGEARKGPLARTINAKRWSDPTNGTRSEWANRSQFVTIGTCTSLSFETATSCVPSPLSLPLPVHHFMRASKEKEKERERFEEEGKRRAKCSRLDDVSREDLASAKSLLAFCIEHSRM